MERDRPSGPRRLDETARRRKAGRRAEHHVAELWHRAEPPITGRYIEDIVLAGLKWMIPVTPSLGTLRRRAPDEFRMPSLIYPPLGAGAIGI